MMSCDSFRKRFHANTDDAALLEHLRSCDRCLDFAAQIDPDVMFRALGGSEMIPPGGIDAFVSGVMQQVRVRDAEKTAIPSHHVSWPRRLAMAAAIGAVIFGATIVRRTPNDLLQPIQHASLSVPQPRALTTKPVVETYESDKATIVEVPSDDTDDVKIVMVIDENLPADL